MSRRGRVGVGVLLVVAGGCGGPEFSAVSGAVTLDGQPLLQKDVEFVPEPGTPGIGARGNTMSDGRYTLVAIRSGAVTETMGVLPGAYRVVVCEPRFGVPVPPAEAKGEEPAPAIGPGGPIPKKRERVSQPIPAIYTKKETTPLRVEVPPGGGAFDLTLTSKR